MGPLMSRPVQENPRGAAEGLKGDSRETLFGNRVALRGISMHRPILMEGQAEQMKATWPAVHRRGYLRPVTFLILLVLVAGCSTPVGVRTIGPREADRTLAVSVLTGDRLSGPTRQIVNRLGLADTLRKDPPGAIAALHRQLAQEEGRRSDLLFALAETSFLHAAKSRSRPYFLSAAIYAYAFLFPKDTSQAPADYFDPRSRLAVDLYNRGVAEGFAREEDVEVPLSSGTFELPFGELHVDLDPRQLVWGSFRLTGLVQAGRLRVRGLRNDYRWPGIGAPLVASATALEGVTEPTFARVPPDTKVALTAFLRIEEVEEGIRTGRLRSKLEIYTTDRATIVHVQGRTVPIEYDLTSTLAYSLEGSKAYRLEILGFLKGDVSLFREVARFEDGLFLLAPYQPGRIPLVLVHGTVSSPARWAELINELTNDRELWGRYQIWLFTYNTGNPILYSAGILAEALRKVRRELDPEGRDPALGNMVLVGHSQGGILARLMATESGNAFWDSVFTVPFTELEIDPDLKGLLRRSMFFTPLPFVKRVVFIATPHGGSFIVGGWPGRLVGRLVSLPARFLEFGKGLAMLPTTKGTALFSMRNIPRSTDDMGPGSDFVRTLRGLPLSPKVMTHSIIAVKNPDAPEEDWNDGVVSYRSARLDGTSSELIVRSGHSTHGEPAAIEEVRRILLEHLHGLGR